MKQNDKTKENKVKKKRKKKKTEYVGSRFRKFEA